MCRARGYDPRIYYLIMSSRRLNYFTASGLSPGRSLAPSVYILTVLHFLLVSIDRSSPRALLLRCVKIGEDLARMRVRQRAGIYHDADRATAPPPLLAKPNQPAARFTCDLKQKKNGLPVPIRSSG